ncbi:DUF7264 domain-containing protein [Mycolicibacterium aichiense]|uniref:LtfC/p132/Gp6 beta-sandwich domain-containing protein n=1 Tax=Mycolicibacterium aichiense TaxID=1799 RepID=A0AAD1MDE6_9MYCO|nr:hypothetical protein [Mycolicibacterium aichiense]MCV7016734.1 hypothetical protein [Mycolicibacterium aichiense]QFG07975.1 hypothetical protein SEA_HERBERTWM_3 [Mycobacterium phage Herbertwm]BBX09483.1 hypothetical protein MAIC_42860 [Mycolicibacterium aichiense]SUA14048.1 Uncharacterised protein [Mycolicibacterium aichiense]
MATIGIELDKESLVVTKGRDFTWAFDNIDAQGNPTPFPPGDLFFELETGGEHNCVQQVEILGAEDGIYTFSYDGAESEPIDFYNADQSPYDLTVDVRSALENIPAIGAGNVKVSRTGLNPVWHLNVKLTGHSQNEKQRLNVTNLLGWLGQQLGEGRMILSYRANDTDPIRFEADAPTIQAALEELPQLGKGNIVVTKVTGGVGTNFDIEYTGLLAARDVDLITVHAYKQDANDFFGGGLTGNLLTRFDTRTIQNGRRSVLDGRMMDTLTQKVMQFFEMFDNKLPIELEFDIKSNTEFTIICRSLKGYTEVDLVTFDVLFNGGMLKQFFENQTLLAGAVESVAVDQYWNHRYTVEFINKAGNRPHPLLVGNASALTNDITATPVTPEIRTEYIDLGRRATTLWDFDIEGSRATLKVESEEVDTIGNRTPWQLVFLPEGEPRGGFPVTRGNVTVQQ